MNETPKERALQQLVPGARVRIVASHRGLFDDGAEIVIDQIDHADDWLFYHYPEDFVWEDPKSGESFPMAEMFGGGQSCFSPFFNPEILEWEVMHVLH